jgi:hypothetical protein
MNHAYIRPGGVAIDLPDDGLAAAQGRHRLAAQAPVGVRSFCNENPIFKGRMQGVGYLDLTGCMALGVTGPVLRAAGCRGTCASPQPYCGYETYDFDVITWDTCDAYGRFRIRLDEMSESLKIVEQCYDRLEATTGQPVMVEDPKIAWPAQLAVGADGQGNSERAHQAHHGRVDGGPDPPLQAGHRGLPRAGRPGYAAIESPKGELGVPRRLRRRHAAVPGPHARPSRSTTCRPRRRCAREHDRRRRRGRRQHRPGDGRGRPMSGHEFESYFPESGSVDLADQSTSIDETTYAELRDLASRYPQPRSALLPMLHLVQSVDGRISPKGIEACAEVLGITTAQVSGVATFYTMYKRRPAGPHHVGVCTNTLCAVMGGDVLLETVSSTSASARRDHRRRQDLPRAHRVQRGLRLRPGDDGQLGVHGQHDPRQGEVLSTTCKAPARRSLHPRRDPVQLARGRARARRLPRRPRRRGPQRRRRLLGLRIAEEKGSPTSRPRPCRPRRRRLPTTAPASRRGPRLPRPRFPRSSAARPPSLTAK